MKSFRITADDAGQRLDKYVKRRLPLAAESFAYKMLRKKNIVVNGKKADPKLLLRENDEVVFFLSDETFGKFSGVTATKGEVFEEAFRELSVLSESIIYEDGQILIIDKPAGVLVQKAEKEDVSVNEWLIGYLLQTGGITKEDLVYFKPAAVHRLDRNTSGLLILAKTLLAERELTKAFREDRIEKYYRLIVAGQVPKNGAIEGYLKKDEKANTVTFSKEEVPGSKYSKTEYERLSDDKLGACCFPDTNTLSYVEAKLLTGRSHQLRVHFASTGHPILLDPKYGNEKINRRVAEKLPADMEKRQLLHSFRIRFPALPEALSDLSKREVECAVPAIFDLVMNEN